MARYTGPRVRISRRFGIPIFGPTKYLERRNYGPGVHGPKSRRKTPNTVKVSMRSRSSVITTA